MCWPIGCFRLQPPKLKRCGRLTRQRSRTSWLTHLYLAVARWCAAAAALWRALAARSKKITKIGRDVGLAESGIALAMVTARDFFSHHLRFRTVRFAKAMQKNRQAALMSGIRPGLPQLNAFKVEASLEKRSHLVEKNQEVL